MPIFRKPPGEPPQPPPPPWIARVTPFHRLAVEREPITGRYLHWMQLYCYGVYFGNSSQRATLGDHYREDKAVLSGFPIASPAPSVKTFDYRQYCAARVDVEYLAGFDLDPPPTQYRMKIYVVGAENAKAAIYEYNDLRFSETVEGEREFEITTAPPERGRTWEIYVVLESEVTVQRYRPRLEFKAAEFYAP